MAQAVHYTFTLNNYNDGHITLLRDLTTRNDSFTYIIYGKEVGEKGTPHLQGYIQLSGGKRLRTVKNLMGLPTLHLEAAMGSDEHNFNYCSKDNNFEEYGERRAIRAKRASSSTPRPSVQFQEIVRQIKAGASLRDIIQEFPMEFIKHHAGIIRVHSMYLKKPFPIKHGPWKWDIQHDWNTSLLLWGKAGIGKTCFAQSLLPTALFVSHLDQLKSYDPTNNDGIIFDDMSFKHFPREAQIHLVDIEQDRSIHCRHTCAWIPAWTKKIFLSNLEEIFLNDPAINRRLTKINLY